jgi:hypothetical protein
MDLIVLVCVVLAALAAGVLAAYGVCLAMFAAFRMHVRQVAVGKSVAAVNAPAGTATAIGS